MSSNGGLLMRSGSLVGIKGMSLNAIINNAISTKHYARIKQLTRVIRFEPEYLSFSITPTEFISSLVSPSSLGQNCIRNIRYTAKLSRRFLLSDPLLPPSLYTSLSLRAAFAQMHRPSWFVCLSSRFGRWPLREYDSTHRYTQ